MRLDCSDVPPRRKGRRRRASWQALLLGAALLLLQGFGLYGLRQSALARLQGARDEAQREARELAAQAARDWAELTDAALQPKEFRVPPLPGAPSAAEARYRQALAASPAEGDALLAGLATQSPDAVTESGVPLLPLVRWAELRREGDTARLPARATAAARAAVETAPSTITAPLLAAIERLLQERAGEVSAIAEWRRRWAKDERAREVLRTHEAVLTSTKGPVWIETPAGGWWIALAAPGAPRRLVPPERVRAVAQALRGRGRALLPPYAALQVDVAGRTLVHAGMATGEVLASAADGPVVATSALAAPSVLYAQVREQAQWLLVPFEFALVGALVAFHASERAARRERQLGEMKSNFVASVSHELRAPVASMRLMAENLASGAVSAEERRAEYHQLIAEECGRLSALIENVLDFACIEQNRKGYDFAETDLMALAEDTVQLMLPRARQRRQEIRTELETLDPPPLCDGLAVRQALLNLLENALKFSPPSTTITVRLSSRAGEGWQLGVEDEGSGIAPAEQRKIFERFYRVGSELRRETPGAGIGLAIVQHIVAAHGGRVEVRSAPGAGATFTLAFPAVPPAVQAVHSSPCRAS